MKEVLTAAQRDLASPQYLRKYQTDPIFVKPVTLRIRDTEIAGFCYYDLQREQDERNLFYLRLHDLKQKFESLQILRWRKPEEVVREWAAPLAKYAAWELQDDNRMGQQIILVRGSLDWEECLTVYRERDVIEKAFRSMKTDLQVMPLKMRNEATLKEYLFITFLSLILRMRLLKRMKDTDLLKHYTLEGLLLELAKIKKVRLANGEVITTENLKRQRTILDTLGVCA